MKVSIITLQFSFVIFLRCWNFSETCCTPSPRPQYPPRPRPTRPPPRPPSPIYTETIPTISPEPPDFTSEAYPDIETPPWDISIPSVINPNYEDGAPSFTATISSPYEEPICSATIISLHFLVSSCIRCLQQHGRPIPSASIRILIGDLEDEMAQMGMGISVYEVDRVIIHPRCLYRERYNLRFDLGVIKTIEEIGFNRFVGAAKIPPNDGTYHPSQHANWMLSAFRSRNTIATTLSESVWSVKVRNVKSDSCQKVLNSTFYDPTYNFCTAYYHGARNDGCADDYGASLSINNYLIGILIHKFDCGRPGSAGSHVSVMYSRDWVNKAVQELSNQKESV